MDIYYVVSEQAAERYGSFIKERIVTGEVYPSITSAAKAITEATDGLPSGTLCVICWSPTEEELFIVANYYNDTIRNHLPGLTDKSTSVKLVATLDRRVDVTEVENEEQE